MADKIDQYRNIGCEIFGTNIRKNNLRHSGGTCKIKYREN